MPRTRARKGVIGVCLAVKKLKGFLQFTVTSGMEIDRECRMEIAWESGVINCDASMHASNLLHQLTNLQRIDP